MIVDKDLVIGQGLITVFELFIDTFIKDGRSVKTVKYHVTHLTILGSEIIRRLNDGDESNQTLSPKASLLEYFEEEYGPLIHHWNPNDRIDEAHKKSFDATCRQLFKFVTASQ